MFVMSSFVWKVACSEVGGTCCTAKTCGGKSMGRMEGDRKDVTRPRSHDVLERNTPL